MSEPVEKLNFNVMDFKLMAAYRAYSDRSDWVDGSLLCTAIFEKSFEHEIEKGEFPLSQVCHATCPDYKRILEVELGTETPLVNASDMKINVNLLKAIRDHEEPREELRP